MIADVVLMMQGRRVSREHLDYVTSTTVHIVGLPLI